MLSAVIRSALGCPAFPVLLRSIRQEHLALHAKGFISSVTIHYEEEEGSSSYPARI